MVGWRSSSALLALLWVSVWPVKASQAPAHSATFANGQAWEALAGVNAEVVALRGRGACLHVRGNQEGSSNYIRGRGFRLTAGRKYRVSGLLKVVSVRPAIPPYLKVECIGGGAPQFVTGRYDLAAGGWQELTAEFEPPLGTDGGWVALEKGTDGRAEIDACMDEVSVMETEQFTADGRYRFDTPPALLAALQGVHPRVHLTTERLRELRAQVGQEPYASLLRELRRVADRRATEGPPAYRGDDGWSGEEQLYQREVGNAIPNLALTYLLTGERKYLDAARAWMLASAGYPTWGLGETDGLDLAAGHQLYGLALAYDWLYHELDREALATVRACLERRGRRMYERVLNGQVWWHDAYLQNHLWVNMTGLAAAGMALFGEVAGVDGWMLLPLEKARVTMASLGPDGASHEGVPYWSYGLEYLLKFMDLARDLLGVDLFGETAWFRHTTAFRLYAMLPRSHWTRGSDLMTFADGPRYDWYGPDYMLRKLAAEYRDGHAQWLADELRTAGLCNDAAAFLNLLWEEPSVAPEPPAKLPPFRRFDDLGLVFMRSSWDGDESVMALKCGPFIGHHALARYSYDPGGGHVHPDAGSFLLFGHGDWLVVDDGYTWKTTAFQNTALVNGIGQEGEGGAWFDGSVLCAEKRGASVLRADHTDDYDYVIGDVTHAYKREAGLKRFLRHILYLRPDCWVIVDELESAAPATFELYFHSDFPFRQVRDGLVFDVRGKSGSLRLTVLAPEGATAESLRQPLVGTNGKPAGELDALRVSHGAAQSQVLFVTVLEAHPASQLPRVRPALISRGEEKVLTLTTPDGRREFGLQAGQADRSSPVLVELQ